MISRLGLWITRVFQAIVPDPLVIAVLLSLLTAVLAVGFGQWDSANYTDRLAALLDSWRSSTGLWKLMDFAMKMCLILVTGHALADAPIVRRALQRLASLPRTTAGAAAMIGFAACTGAIVNWGLGLIAGAILAREVGRSFQRRRLRLHYPLVVAAGYTGLMVWHGGLSGSAPLSMTSRAEAAKVLPASSMANLGEVPVPLTETLFAPFNLIITGGLVIIVPVVLALLAPKRPEDFVAPPPFEDVLTAPQPEHRTIPDRLERSVVVMLILAIPLLIATIRFLQQRSMMQFGLNEFIGLMLALGLLLHRSLRSYGASVDEAARGCAGIILQFPLYAGIMAMMESSGLAKSLADAIASAGGPRLVPVLTFIAAAITNLFVPSGGGQWAVQGPIALQSGLTAGVPMGKMVMSVAYGDQLTNMLQPFWALPLLAITGAKAREIVGYCAVVMFAGAAWITLWLIVL